MSDLVALDRRSMRDKRMCNRNVRKPIWCICEPVWRLECLFWIMTRVTSVQTKDRRPEHSNQPMYQNEHFKHIPIILHMKIKSWII